MPLARCPLTVKLALPSSIIYWRIISFFSPAGAMRSRYPVHLRPLNEEIFKSMVMDILKCTNDINVQQSYVGDGEGSIHLSGLGIPPIALMDGSSPGLEILFKHCLHEVKALFDSLAHLKNPSAPEATAA